MIILSCSGHFPSVRSDLLIKRCYADYGSICHVTSTQFSLPFSDLSGYEQDSWLEYRYAYFKASTYRSMEEQVMTESCASHIWAVFISRGHRRLLGLPSCETLGNGIRVLWVEIDRVFGKEPDYYRSIVMESICIKLAERELSMNKGIRCFVFTRVDSDDYIGRRFVDLTTAVSINWTKSLSSTDGAYFNYPCGLTYNKVSGITSSKIWPESSFTFYVARSQAVESSIWKWPHDIISHHVNNGSIVTTLPMWCITTNHGNIANTVEDYFSTKPLNHDEILDSIY